MLLYNVNLQSFQIAPPKSASTLEVFLTPTLAVIVWNRPNM